MQSGHCESTASLSAAVSDATAPLLRRPELSTASAGSPATCTVAEKTATRGGVWVPVAVGEAAAEGEGGGDALGARVRLAEPVPLSQPDALGL